MLWFFVFPSLLFMGWASYKFVGTVLHPKPQDAFTKLEDVRSAKSAGDRWQAAYGLAQALQNMSHSGELKNLPDAKKDELYNTLADVLKNHASDARLRKYLFLTLGQMGDARALPSLELGLKDLSPESRFYAAWGLIEILSKNPTALRADHIATAHEWMKDEDPAFRKIGTTFLANQGDANSLRDIEGMLNDRDREVRWNAAVALASKGSSKAVPVLTEVFDLKVLRSVEFKSSEDLTQVVAAGYGAARKLNNPALLAAAQNLKATVDVKTPEGRAIHAAIRDN